MRLPLVPPAIRAACVLLAAAGCTASRMRVETANAGGQVAAVVSAHFRADGEQVQVLLVGRTAAHDSPEVHLAFSLRCAVGPQSPRASRLAWWIPVARLYESPRVRGASLNVERCDDSQLVLQGTWELEPGELVALMPDVFPVIERGPGIRRLSLGRVTATPGDVSFVVPASSE